MKTQELQNICSFRSGGTPSKSDESLWGNHLPWVSAKDMKLPVLQDSILKLSKEGKAKAKIAPGGSLLILVRGMTLFKNVPVCLAGCDLSFNQDIKALVLKDGIDPKYILYFLLSSRSKLMRLVDSAGHGTGRLNTELLKAFPVLLPPLPEQKAIADLLSTWDAAIEKTERLVEAKERRLEGFGNNLFHRRTLHSRKEWKSIKLKEVLNEHGDKSTGNEKVFSVSVHKGLINQIEHLGRSFSAANTDHYNRVHRGDIVYTKSPTGNFPLGVVKMSRISEDVIVSPLYGVFTPPTYELGVILDFYFSSPKRSLNYLFPITQKGAKNTIAITNRTFLSKALNLPIDQEEQVRVAELVEVSLREIDTMRKILQNYKTQKRGLMQKLLTGEWRVESVEINQSEGGTNG